MSDPPSYPKTSTNKLGRLAQRGAYDYATIHSLINACPILHVSFNDPEQPFPVVLPMLGCTGNFESQDADPDTAEQYIYIHGYVSGRMFKESGKANDGGGLPVTVAASFLDGLVLALSPFHNSYNYRSAVAYGHATLLAPSTPTSPNPEAVYALSLITNNILPTRWESCRDPPFTSAEISSTSILKVKIVSASAKIRTGGPSDDKKDLKDAALRKRVWTGVVPHWGTWGEPVAGQDNAREEVEEYIEGWRVKETTKARRYAFEAIEMEGGKKKTG